MDYSKLGLKVGLEIHQQLNSGSKLFCRCPLIKADEFPLEIRRKMNPVQSELGEDDPAALFEYLRNRTFIYKANTNSSCLVEMDESPPLPVSEKALKMVVQLSKLMNCRLVDEIYFMRKTVIDGSAVSGFQRTGLIATDGFIETSFGKLGVQTISLEEDSAPALSKGESIEYRLDRLGTPLIEIATDPDIHTPEQAKEAAEKIGTLLRSVDVVRGIGSIRQDVNISITGGSRVEIKGFQELDKIPELVENEVKRQASLVEIKNELKRRGFSGMKNDARDITDMFQHTKCNFVKKALENHLHVYGLKVEKFSGLLKQPCGDRTFGKELSTYPASHGFGIIHSDEELEKYSLTFDFANLRKELGARDEDLILIVVGNNAGRAIQSLVDRINFCLIGVPKETRVADGLGSRYARPLPGSGRLYPESDIPAIKINHALRNIELPKTLEERKEELDIPDQLKDQIVKSKYYSWFLELKQYDPTMAATIFLSTYKDVGRKGFDVEKIRLEDLHVLLQKVSEGTVPKNKVSDILVELCSNQPISTILEKYSVMSEDRLNVIVKSVIHDNPGKSESALIGIVLGKVKGKADGRRISELVKELK